MTVWILPPSLPLPSSTYILCHSPCCGKVQPVLWVKFLTSSSIVSMATSTTSPSVPSSLKSTPTISTPYAIRWLVVSLHWTAMTSFGPTPCGFRISKISSEVESLALSRRSLTEQPTASERFAKEQLMKMFLSKMVTLTDWRSEVTTDG